MTWQGVEMEIQVPCAEGKQHPVRLRFTGWGEYEVVHNPCEELLGAVFARMAPCTHYLREQFPEEFRQDARFRKQLVEALGAVRTPAVPPLIQALGDGDSDVREAACWALGEIGDRQAVPPLIQALRDGNSDVRAAACEALGAIGDGQAVPPLIQALRDWDSDVRVAACRALGEIGDGQAVPPLIQALRDWDSDVRAAACEALVKIGAPAVPHLIQALRDWNSDVRIAVRRALGEIGDGQAVPPLIQALRDWDSDVRVAACRALGEIGDGQAVPPLIQALGDWDSDVRVAACRALGEIGDRQAVPALSVWAHAGERVAQAALQQMGQAPLPLPEAVAQVVAQGSWGVLVRALPHEAVRAAVVELGTPAVPPLIQALGDGDRDVRVAACRALGEIGDRQAVPPLIQALGDGNEYVRVAACEALVKIGDGQAVPALSVWAHAGERVAQAALQQMGQAPLPLPEAVAQVVAQGSWGVLVRALPHEAVRAAVVELGTPAVPPLIQALGDGDIDVRRAACRALGEIGRPAVLPLIQALGDRDIYVRAAACWALGAIGDRQAVPPLIQALGDGDIDVRWAACWALGEIGDRQAVPPLIQALGDRNIYVRAAACEALVKIGDRQAVPPLIQALGDGDEYVRAAACEALVKIGDRQAVPALSVWAHAGERVAQAALQQMGQAPLPLSEAVAQVVAQGSWGVLVRALPHEAVRAAVVELGTPAVPPLIQALGDGDRDVRAAACEALVKIGDRQAVPALSVWAHAGERVAQAALQQMGQAPLPLPEAVAQVVAQGSWGVLVRALPHEAVRAAVVELGTPAVPPLIQALGDEDIDVRRAACRALGEIGDRQAVPPLIQALRDWSSYVRVAACEALGQIGDPQALPHLIQALEDENEDEDVSWAAREAVEQIEAKQFARNEPLD
jgi:HEAT repeat protein